MGTIQKINNAIYIGTLEDLWQNDFYGNKKNMIYKKNPQVYLSIRIDF